MACGDDSDCPGSQVCYINVSWSEGEFCGCSGYYGGAGLNCSGLNLQSFNQVLLSSLNIFLATLYIVVTTCFDMRRGHVYKMFISCVMNNPRMTWLSSFGGLVCVTLYSCLVIYSAVRPETNNLSLASGYTVEKFARYALLERIFLYVSVLLAVASTLNITLVWINKAFKGRRTVHCETRRVEIYRMFIRAIQIGWTIAVITTVNTGFKVLVQTFLSPVLVQALLTPFLMLCIVCVYFVGRIYCRDLFDTLTQTTLRDPKCIEHFAMIRETSTRVVVLLALLMVLVFASIPISLNWKEYSPIRAMSAYSTLIQIMVIMLTLLLGTILNYLDAVLKFL